MLGVHKLINKDKKQFAVSFLNILANYFLPVIRALETEGTTMKNRFLGLIIVVIILSGCASVGPNGSGKPTIMTNPPSYLQSFPLNSITQDQLIQDLGVPDKSIEIGDQLYLSYQLGEGWGEREYIYALEDNLVTDVRYNDQGPYNGSSARQIQNAPPE
ncbi:hypothetical protein [Marinobacter gelidimuriae]|uniref:hypothetical protein n=1 Tax=Marinobacter gelidimuriae TaxID=2739064 RepID=UPI0012DF2A86|nr:hypothetical protein [Marinobacter gelidimuriae]